MQPIGKNIIRATSILAALVSSLQAQTTATTTPATPGSETAIRMNPFELNESTDNSFRASSVGSGSRLTLDLADTPVAYSVINREFIAALGITDLAEAAAWATGNTFYKTDNGGDNFGRPSQYFSRGNLTAQGGADSFGAQRNFYQNSNNGGDSYAVESYDFGRGPNAALFGQGNGAAGDASNGGLAGVSSLQTKRARFDAPKTTLGLEIGSWEYRRATLDYNRPLSERLGIRVNLVDMDRKGWREFDMETSRGATLATTWKIAPSLEFRGEVSTDRHQNRNTGAGQDERFTGWDGQTVFRGPVTNAMFSTNATVGQNNIANASYGTLSVFGLGNGVPENSAAGITWSGETSGVNRQGNQTYFYNVYDGTVMNYQNYAITRRADETSRVPLWTTTAPNGKFFVRGTTDIDGNPNDRFGRVAPFGLGRSFWVKDGLPSDLFDRTFNNSKFKFPSQRWIPTLDKPATEQRSKDANVALTYTKGNLAMELGGDINRNHNETRSWDNPGGAMGGGRSASIDINMTKPDGTPNPGFLDVINSFGMSQADSITIDQTLRLNVGYTQDWGRFGNYVFNVQASSSDRDFESRNLTFSLKTNADSRRWQNDTVSIVAWGSDKVRAYKEPKSVVFTDVNWSTPNNPVIQAPRLLTPSWVTSNYSDTTTTTTYGLAQLTAKWFNNRVIFTGALRRDLAEGYVNSAIAQGDRPKGWMGELIYRPDAPADYFSLTYVQRNNTTGLPITGKAVLAPTRPRTTDAATGLSIPNPLYLNDRFRDDYNTPRTRSYGTNQSTGVVFHVNKMFSPYVNFSNTYTPQTATSLDLNGIPRESVKANGYDMGANFALLDNKVALKFNYYIQTRLNDSFTPPASANINTLYQANVVGDADTTDSGRNARGAANLPGADYQDRRNSGFEIEASIQGGLPGLRFTANGSSGFFTTKRQGRLIKEYVAVNQGLFKQILEDAGGQLDTSRHPVDAPHSPGLAVASSSTGIDTTSAVDAYNNLYINMENLLLARELKVPTQPQMNILGDYTLQSGPLRGLGISAGIQWQGRFILLNKGSDTILDPNQAIPTAIDDPQWDVNDYRFLKGQYQTQANFRYSFRLKSGDTLGLALRINNPINDRSINISDAAVGGQGLGFGGATAIRPPAGSDLTKPNRVLQGGQPSAFSEPINFRLNMTYTFGNGR